MKISSWASRPVLAAVSIAFAVVVSNPALSQEVTVKKGTDLHLVFDSSLSSKTAKVGDRVRFHVEDPLQVNGTTVVARGTKVIGIIQGVHGRGRYGVNARVQLHMTSVRAVNGQAIPIQSKTRGSSVGNRTGEAAAATAGSALLLGPIGLAAGLFVVGKNVSAHPGDKATVEVARDTTVHVK